MITAVADRLEIPLEEAKAYFRVDSDVEDEVIVGCLGRTLHGCVD